MTTLVLNIPDTVDFDKEEALMLIAVRLYEKGQLTIGQAADLVGLSKRTFMELLSSYSVPVINHPSTDLDRDVENAKKMRSTNFRLTEELETYALKKSGEIL